MKPTAEQAASNPRKRELLAGRISEQASVSNCHLRGLLTLAERHGVSLRTARRIEAGTYAPEQFKDYWGKTVAARTVGKDGKSYPHQRKRYHRADSDYVQSRILECLRQAKSGLKRADSIACEAGFTPDALARLEALGEQVAEIVARWRSAAAPSCCDQVTT